MRRNMKSVSALLAAVFILSMSIPVLAEGIPSEKEEVVYIMTDASGSIENINVVNVFGSGDITDYGDYAAVKMLTTNDVITQDGSLITFSTTADKVYYQGTMENAEIPWSISIRYFLDGTEYSAQDIAGKSGKLEVRFTITKNEGYKGSFYDNYALQASFTLSTERCDNISAPDATLASVGKNKQLTYTILPGKGVDTVIIADVADFEMAAVSMNGIKLNLNITIDDSELMDKVRELMDGVAEIDDGAASLNEGMSELKTGSSSLKDGASTVKSGAESLDSGITQLQTGITLAKTGLHTLNEQSGTLVNGSAEVKTALETIGSSLSGVSVTADQLTQLTAASGQINTGITNLYAGIGKLQNNIGYPQYKALMTLNGLDIDILKVGNAQAVSELSAQVNSLQTALSQVEGIPGYEEQTAQLQAQIDQLQNIAALLNGNNAAIGGTESYLTGLSDAVKELHEGAAELKEKYEEFDAAIGELVNTLGNTLVDLSDLSSGISTLIENYAELDKGIGEYTDGVAQLAAGYGQIMEGVSELAQGSKDLSAGAGSLYSGTVELFDGVIVVCDGIKELADGTGEMRNKTSDMDSQVQEQIDDMLSSIGGDNGETVSFVSEKNANVDSVQFVIKTAAIEKTETDVAETNPQEILTFWQKLLQLFGLY